MHNLFLKATERMLPFLARGAKFKNPTIKYDEGQQRCVVYDGDVLTNEILNRIASRSSDVALSEYDEKRRGDLMKANWYEEKAKNEVLAKKLEEAALMHEQLASEIANLKQSSSTSSLTSQQQVNDLKTQIDALQQEVRNVELSRADMLDDAHAQAKQDLEALRQRMELQQSQTTKETQDKIEKALAQREQDLSRQKTELYNLFNTKLREFQDKANADYYALEDDLVEQINTYVTQLNSANQQINNLQMMLYRG